LGFSAFLLTNLVSVCITLAEDKKMLNKQEAWKYVANDLLTTMRYGFICNTLTEMYMNDRITNDTKLQMLSDLGSVVFGEPGYFHYNLGALRMTIDEEISWDTPFVVFNERRALLCLFISQLSEAEIEEMNEPTL
jgi:hypothetical protein